MRLTTSQVSLSSTFLICALAMPQQSNAQEHAAAKSVTEELEEAVAPARSESLQILYTGKLLGYFRMPDGQSPDATGKNCPESVAEPSLAVQGFEKLLKEKDLKHVILVGTGDNFAPEVEARKFCSPPKDQDGAQKPFQRLGKDFFAWDGHDWRTNEYFSQKSVPVALRERLASGGGSIPNDNVAGFFVREGYAAVVPGKHDFYYGPERLRELAWLLAGTNIENTRTIHSKTVQMLGANLVIETTWKTGHETLSDRKEPPWFIPRFPTASDLTGRTDIELKLSGITDGGSVYPWFQGPSLTLSKADASLQTKVEGMTFYLCAAKMEGDPNSIPNPKVDCGQPLDKPIFKKDEETKPYQLRFRWQDETTKWSTLIPGKNYALCVDAPTADPRLQDRKNGQFFCVRFSTYIPFFQYPAKETSAGLESPENRVPPLPYVLLKKGPDLGEDVAIFGAVDPHLSDYIGLLNLSWTNANKHFKTQVAFKDPAEALKQVDAYFERKFQEECGKPFDGVKILLAQMSPQEAEVLARNTGKYQVVVSAADAERAAYDRETSIDWKPALRENKTPEAGGQLAGLLAVPEPFYDARRKKPDGSSWVVDIGSLEIQSPNSYRGNWHVESKHFWERVDYKVGSSGVPKFWNLVQHKVAEHCVPQESLWSTTDEEHIQWLTLCAMQDNAEADIAVLQKRDFFPTLPEDTKDIVSDVDRKPGPNLQEIVDRIIWKGDFLMVSHLPGSIIQKMMAQSKIYEADEKSPLSLSDEKGRGLVYVGIRYDDEQNEYLVNGVPLDPNKLYAVVTSDFVSSGDTGYPDLAAGQINPPVTPRDLERKLLKISSVVCGRLAGPKKEDINKSCLDPISRKPYFDDIVMAPRNTRHVNTPEEQLESWSWLHNPGPVPGDPSRLTPPPTPSAAAAADKIVEERQLWDFAMTKWTLGITALGHNRSDYDVQNDFGGVSASGVNAVRSSMWSSDMQAQYTRNWQHNQILVTPTYTFNTQYKGQPDDLRQVNQQTDLGMFDLAAVHLWNGRGPEHVDTIFSGHFETPLAKTFNAFALATTHPGIHGEAIKDQLRFAQDRSYTELLRPGMRWMRRKSSAEIGPEWGHEWNALDGFTFITNGTPTNCLATATISISQCVKNTVKANPQSITPASEVRSLRSGHNHAGIYWKLNLTVPFNPKVSYVFTDTGDWFFVHYHTNNSTDTRFRDVEQHQLKLMLFPSLSIGPEVDLLFYKNATAGTLTGHFLRQDVVMMKAQFSFDVFNGRKLWQEIKYAPPASPK
jgi:hypothetical protein